MTITEIILAVGIPFIILFIGLKIEKYVKWRMLDKAFTDYLDKESELSEETKTNIRQVIKKAMK